MTDRRPEDRVTFGGAGLNRLAHLRGRNAQIEAETKRCGVRATLFWRSKPLLQMSDGSHQLVQLERDHPLLSEAHSEPILIGQYDEGPLIFAYDLSDWEPEECDLSGLDSFTDRSIQTHPLAPEGAGFAERRSVMASLDARDAEVAVSARAIFEWHRTHSYCANCGAKTDMAMSGWQRNCPECGRIHFPRTDPVAIVLVTHGNRVLVGRSHGWPEGMYSLLAGFIEPGETIENGAAREVFEEAGITIADVQYVTSQPWPFPASLMIGLRAEALNDEIKLDPEELDDAIWVSREDMVEAYYGRHAFLKPARRGSIAHFLIGKWLEDRRV